jgi:hypothetical protein
MRMCAPKAGRGGTRAGKLGEHVIKPLKRGIIAGGDDKPGLGFEIGNDLRRVRVGGRRNNDPRH